MPQCGMPKGKLRRVLICVRANAKKKAATPHTHQTQGSATPMSMRSKPTIEGGTTMMNKAGTMRGGKGPTCTQRTTSKACMTGHKNSPRPNCAMAQGSNSIVSPARGASAFPTTGINNIGVMAFQLGPPASLACNQRAVTQSVAAISSKEPTAHTTRSPMLKFSDTFQNIDTPKPAKSMMEMGMVARNGC